VNLRGTNRTEPSTADDYATSDDFRKLFLEGVEALHLLAYLLTGDHERAEQCFVTGLENCVNHNSIFKEWARSWAQRMIVQSAIRMMAPRPNHAGWTRVSPDPFATLQSNQAKHAAFATVLALGDFERFVFVLSVLERYSDQDCSILLNCLREDVAAARIRALQQISDMHYQHGVPEDDATTPPQAMSREWR
jgi:DNA-directed RNA polymerase specialized sigma24 family protein